MTDINSVILRGEVSAMPVKTKTSSGWGVRFFVVVKRPVKIGRKFIDQVSRHEVLMLGKPAERAYRMLVAGMRVQVMGRMKNVAMQVDMNGPTYNYYLTLASNCDILKKTKYGQSNRRQATPNPTPGSPDVPERLPRRCPQAGRTQRVEGRSNPPGDDRLRGADQAGGSKWENLLRNLGFGPEEGDEIYFRNQAPK